MTTGIKELNRLDLQLRDDWDAKNAMGEGGFKAADKFLMMGFGIRHVRQPVRHAPPGNGQRRRGRIRTADGVPVKSRGRAVAPLPDRDGRYRTEIVGPGAGPGRVGGS